MLMAFTNHALDHILRAVVEQGVTKRFTRLGAKCNDEVVEPFLLKNLERAEKGSKAIYQRDLYNTSKAIDELHEVSTGRCKMRTSV